MGYIDVLAPTDAPSCRVENQATTFVDSEDEKVEAREMQHGWRAHHY